MPINKKMQNHNNMLFMLASLACGQNDSNSCTSIQQQTMPRIAAVSDISDDDTPTIDAKYLEKKAIVARRRRRPIKKRLPIFNDQESRSPLMYFGSTIKPRKSLLEKSIHIACEAPKKRRRNIKIRTESRDEQSNVSSEQESKVIDSDRANEEVPALVCDDEAWKGVHSPLDLPSFLPCPATALRDVESICLTLDQR